MARFAGVAAEGFMGFYGEGTNGPSGEAGWAE